MKPNDCNFTELFAAGFFILLLWLVGHFIWHWTQPKMIPVPRLYFDADRGAWVTDGTKEMVQRAVDAARLGEKIEIPNGTVQTWANKWEMPVSESTPIKPKPAIIEAHDNTFPADEEDHEDIYAEVENGKTAEASEAMMWAIRSDPKYKWAELRWKDPEGKILLVVRHTKPKGKP